MGKAKNHIVSVQYFNYSHACRNVMLVVCNSTDWGIKMGFVVIPPGRTGTTYLTCQSGRLRVTSSHAWVHTKLIIVAVGTSTFSTTQLFSPTGRVTNKN